MKSQKTIQITCTPDPPLKFPADPIARKAAGDASPVRKPHHVGLFCLSWRTEHYQGGHRVWSLR